MVSAAIIAQLEDEIGIRLKPDTARPVGGGCIHEALLIDREDGRWLFLKHNRKTAISLFEAEASSLRLLHQAGQLRVPEPYCHGCIGDTAYLAMEGLSLSSGGSPAAQASLGEKLATLHETVLPNGLFGAEFDNFIGATPQSNQPHSSWSDFFVEERLVPQFRLAGKRGKLFPREAEICSTVHAHLSDLRIDSVLLHGDLWGGNVGFLMDDEPVIFDPACYFGDRETDLAFTKMFGGFSSPFYEAYRAVHPEPEPIREVIYNLYHLLNHFNLFGGGYASSAEASMERILKTL